MKKRILYGERGQVFTLDILLALVALTAIIGYMSWQFEEVYTKSSSFEAQKINAIANDWSQIGVKNLLAQVDKKNNILVNVVDLDSNIKWKDFVDEMKLSLTNEYAADVSMGTKKDSINGGCIGAEPPVAVSRRVVVDEGGGSSAWLEVRVCQA